MRPRDEEIFARDCFTCQYCGFEGKDFRSWAFLQVDHFIPRSEGGTDAPDNLVTSCVICNQMKSAKIWENTNEAAAEIRQWWDQMRDYWEQNVKPLLDEKIEGGSQR